MYTFNPLPIQNSLDDHSGFYFMCVVMTVFGGAWLVNSYWNKIWQPIIVCAAVLGVSAVVSWNTGGIIRPVNTPVVGTFVAYQPEGYNIEERSGKTTRRVDYHLLYVVYSIPGSGNVILQATAGQVYPQRVILYKN